MKNIQWRCKRLRRIRWLVTVTTARSGLISNVFSVHLCAHVFIRVRKKEKEEGARKNLDETRVVHLQGLSAN